MKIKVGEKDLKLFLIKIIPFFIFLAIDGIFSIHSIVPIILLCFGTDLLFKKMNRDNTLIISIILFIVSSVISLTLNQLSGNGLTTTQTYIRIVYYSSILYLYFSLTRLSYSKKEIESVLSMNIVCGVLVSLYLIFINHIWFYSIFNEKIDKNFVAAILAIQGIYSLIKFIEPPRKNKLYLLAYVIILLGIFYSASRASVLVYILGTVMVLFFNTLKKVKSKKTFIRLLLFILLIPVILFFTYNLYLKKLIITNSSIGWYWNRYFVNGFGDDSVTGRWIWWDNALKLFTERPICGYGIGNVNVSGNSSAVSHNTYIDFLVDQGIIGFISYLLILIRSLKQVFKSKNRLNYSIVAMLLLNSMVLSATRSTYLWYNLILLYSISNCNESCEERN